MPSLSRSPCSSLFLLAPCCCLDLKDFSRFRARVSHCSQALSSNFKHLQAPQGPSSVLTHGAFVHSRESKLQAARSDSSTRSTDAYSRLEAAQPGMTLLALSSWAGLSAH
ncbi:hypothetical protein C8R45DRAFT_931241 [Mycena sanguinolenta]|nr:hypothetical protein C8R45DRAFT_931241 [Mycena sanguinolenta]